MKTFVLCFLVVACYASGENGNGKDSAAGLAAKSQQSSQSKNGESELADIAEVVGSAGALLSNWVYELTGVSKNKKESWDSLQSPRHTTMTFISAMEDVPAQGSSAIQRALSTFPMSTDNARDKAEQLYQVFARLKKINPLDLPGKRQIASIDLDRFEIFPYALEHEWVWQALGKAPEGTIALRYYADDESWRFSPQTLAGIDKLAVSMAAIPPHFNKHGEKGKLFIDIFRPTIVQTPWWHWCVFFGILVAGYFLSRGLKRLFYRSAQRLNDREWPIVSVLVRGVGNPSALVLFTLVLIIAFGFIHFSATLNALYWSLVEILLLLSLVWLAFNLADLIAAFLRKTVNENNDEFTEMAVELSKRAFRALLIALVLVFVLEKVLGINIGALITGIGIVGLALSLAGKESAQNLFGALYVFFNRPFLVGDWIHYKGSIGAVEEVGMQSSSVRLLSGEVLVIPNKQFVDNEVENLSLRHYLRREMDIALPYSTPAEKVDEAIATLKDILTRDDIMQEGQYNADGRAPFIAFSDYENYYLNIKVYYWYYIGEHAQATQRRSDRGWYTYLEHCSDVNGAILKAFNERGIEFAFPTQTLHLKNDNDDKSSENDSADSGELRYVTNNGHH